MATMLSAARRHVSARPYPPDRWGESREGVPVMPARSKARQKAARAALSAKRGDTAKSALKGASREMEASMTETELEDLASTRRKGKPEHVEKPE